jgi:hypothetical protein
MLILLGMHRSGTSLCARICRELGVYLGDDLLSGGSDNPDGYFEDRAIVRAHGRILTMLDRNWAGTCGFLPFPEDWLLRSELQPEFDRLARRAERLCAEAAGQLAGFKDPRTARLLPAWNKFWRRLGVRPRFLLSVRHPLGVYQSLAARDGIGAARSELLWLQHNVAAVSHSGPRPFLVVSYDRWLTDAEAQTDRLADFLATPKLLDREARRRVLSMIDASKNHASPAIFSPAFPSTMEIYDGLRREPMDVTHAVERFHAQEASIVRRVCSELTSSPVTR